MVKQSISKLLRRLNLSICGVVLAWMVLAACGRLPPPGPDQALVVGLPVDSIFDQSAPPTEGMEGYCRDLSSLFAESLGVEVRFVTAPDMPGLHRLLNEGRVHFAAALPTTTAIAGVRFTQPLRKSRQLVVRHVNSRPIDGIEQLAGQEISALPGSPQIAALKALGIVPAPQIVERPSLNSLELLTGVALARFNLALTDELHFSVAANAHPDLAIAVALPIELSYVWAFAETSETLRQQAIAFIERAAQDNTLRRLESRYFDHIRRLDRADIGAFLGHLRSRLPAYRHAFHDAQEITGIDWRMLAALAYQESQWDPLATSFTNVRGMMMLTEETADRMEVDNRLDAHQSIVAGAKYLAMLMDDLPAEVDQPDRLWFALAAYNLGMGHLRGARTIAARLQRNPDSWMDMKTVLPLMAQPEYYQRLKSGRARGGEAVILVENVRNYFDVLSRLEPLWTPPSLNDDSPPSKSPPRPRLQRSGVSRSTPPI